MKTKPRQNLTFNAQWCIKYVWYALVYLISYKRATNYAFFRLILCQTYVYKYTMRYRQFIQGRKVDGE